MKSVNIPSHILKPGMTTFEDLFNSMGVLVLGRDVTLDQSQIDKILLNNIERVRIRLAESTNLYGVDEDGEIRSVYDQAKIKDFREKYTAEVSEVTSIIKEIGKGVSVDVYSVCEISKRIVAEFKAAKEIINYLQFVRDLDDDTYSHSLNVCLLSVIIAKWLELKAEEIDEIAAAGLLHDIGKTRVSEKLLRKPGKLTPEEFEEIKKHTVIGYMMMDGIKDVTGNMRYTVLMHHEKIDGSGYPMGALDEEIPLFPKIVAVADIYDAMTSNRTYRKRMCPFEVIKNFEMQTFGKLDTKVLTTFLGRIANSYVSDYVELNTGEVCEIVFINPNRIWQPIVRFGEEFIDLSQDLNKRYIKSIV